jgi:hypothetical protein
VQTIVLSVNYTAGIYLLENTLHLDLGFHCGTDFKGWKQGRVPGNFLDL